MRSGFIYRPRCLSGPLPTVSVPSGPQRLCLQQALQCPFPAGRSQSPSVGSTLFSPSSWVEMFSSYGIHFIRLSLASGPSHSFTAELIIMDSFEIRGSHTVCNIFGRGRVLKRLSQNLPRVRCRQLAMQTLPLGSCPFLFSLSSGTPCPGLGAGVTDEKPCKQSHWEP